MSKHIEHQSLIFDNGEQAGYWKNTEKKKRVNECVLFTILLSKCIIILREYGRWAIRIRNFQHPTSFFKFLYPTSLSNFFLRSWTLPLGFTNVQNLGFMFWFPIYQVNTKGLFRRNREICFSQRAISNLNPKIFIRCCDPLKKFKRKRWDDGVLSSQYRKIPTRAGSSCPHSQCLNVVDRFLVPIYKLERLKESESKKEWRMNQNITNQLEI